MLYVRVSDLDPDRKEILTQESISEPNPRYFSAKPGTIGHALIENLIAGGLKAARIQPMKKKLE